MKIGIGIDTGGTYTDAIVYDFDSKAILGSAKSLTTKEDLSIGILGALDGLPVELLPQAEILSLSTTLATNACVEDKGGKAKLIFLGGDKRIIDELGGKYGLPSSADICMQDSYTTFSGVVEREPDWDLFRSNIETACAHVDGVGIIEMNAMKNGGVIENKAKEIVRQRYRLPVVCGHELFSELNSLQRGASTLLNASLFPVIQDFLDAIKTAVEKRHIRATVVVVRSDGSLMSEAFSRLHPVETLLCGPAASVMGSVELTRDKNCIVVDMGGTTTDLALVRDGDPVKVTKGISIGKWKTFVNGLYIKTFGLGGDSAVHYRNKQLLLEDYRVVPLCVAAEKYPVILEHLKELVDTGATHTHYLHEHYLLVKSITDEERYTDEERAFCQALEKGPLPLKEAAAAVGKDVYTFRMTRLIQEGVVQICGLTPTDIMHIQKDFTRYSDAASRLAAQYVAANLHISVEELCDRVYDEVKRKLYNNIVQVLLENRYPEYMEKGVNADVNRFIDDAYDMAKQGGGPRDLSLRFGTGYTLLGVGAPIHIFLKDVAELLGTAAAIPPHYEVANALGAIVGNVYADFTVEIRPNYSTDGITGYTVLSGSRTETFEELADAENCAVERAKEGALAEARSRGAVGDIAVTCALDTQEASARDCTVYLGTNAVAHAVGAVRL